MRLRAARRIGSGASVRMRKRSSSCNVRAEEIAGHVSASTKVHTDAGRQSGKPGETNRRVCLLASFTSVLDAAD
jgi:hypothetical protein